MSTTNFTILDNAVASSSRQGGGVYKDTLKKLSVATKQEDGTFKGQGIPCDKEGQIMGFRQAAKDLGYPIITRKQTEGDLKGKTLVMRVNKEDLPARKTPSKKGKAAK